MADFVELGATAFDHIVDKHGDDLYDKVQRRNPLSSSYGNKQQNPSNQQQDNNGDSVSNRSSRRSKSGRPHQRRHQAELPSPERERDDYYSPATYDDRDPERQSETSERLLRDYENERDDPSKPPRASLNNQRRHKMSYGYDDRRPSSHGPSRSRYDDDDSDYDDRTGQRRRRSGRGYDDRDDRPYDREIIETEVYRGPPRDWGNQRSPSVQENGDYAVTQYRQNGDVGAYDKRRSRSRGRHDRDRDYDDDRDYRDRNEGERIREKLDDTFDTTPRGIGVGIAGAIVGGLAGKQFGDRRHNKRDMVIGAVIGGLAVNAAEQKYRDWKEDKEEERLESRYDGRDGRSRSALR